MTLRPLETIHLDRHRSGPDRQRLMIARQKVWLALQTVYLLCGACKGRCLGCAECNETGRVFVGSQSDRPHIAGWAIR